MSDSWPLVSGIPGWIRQRFVLPHTPVVKKCKEKKISSTDVSIYWYWWMIWLCGFSFFSCKCLTVEYMDFFDIQVVLWHLSSCSLGCGTRGTSYSDTRSGLGLGFRSFGLSVFWSFGLLVFWSWSCLVWTPSNPTLAFTRSLTALLTDNGVYLSHSLTSLTVQTLKRRQACRSGMFSQTAQSRAVCEMRTGTQEVIGTGRACGCLHAKSVCVRENEREKEEIENERNKGMSLKRMYRCWL